jgi:hypothetical protein
VSAQEATLDLPFPTRAYQPSYLADERWFRFVDGLSLAEPEIFLPSWALSTSPPPSEPTRHPLGLREMRSVSIGLPDPACISTSLRAVVDAGIIRTHRSAAPELVINFDAQAEVEKDFRALGITLIGTKS